MVIEVKAFYRLHVFVFSFLSVLLFLIVPINFISKSLAITVCIGVLLHMEKINFVYERWYEIIIFVAVNAYLTLAIFGYDLFLAPRPELLVDLFISPDNPDSQPILDAAAPFVRIVYCGFGFIWTSYVLQSIFDVLKSLCRLKDRVCSFSLSASYWKKWFALFTIMFALFMVWQRAYNPIVMSRDSWEYFGEPYLIGRSVMYVFINNLIMQIAPTNPEVEWIGITQIIVFSFLIATILMYFHRKWIRFRWILATAIILPLIPSFGLHTIVIWADLYVGMTVLWATYVIVRIIDEIILRNSASMKQQISLCIQICLAMVFMYFAKANTSVVYLVTMLVLAVFFMMRKQWKLLLSIAFSAILVVLIRFPGHTLLGASRYPSLEAHRYYAGIHDMQATYYHGGDFSEENLALLKHYIPNIDEIKDRFRPDWVERDDWGNLPAVIRNMTSGEFISMYVDTFIRNPYLMFRSIMFRSRTYWAIDPKGAIKNVNRTSIFDKSTGKNSTQVPELDIYRRPNFLTRIMDKYILVMALPVPATFVWRFGIWTVLMIISIAMLMLQKRFIWLLVYIPVFTYLATLFLTSGWTDYRYGLPVFFVGLFLPAALLLLTPSCVEEVNL